MLIAYRAIAHDASAAVSLQALVEEPGAGRTFSEEEPQRVVIEGGGDRVDERRLKESFEHVGAHGDEVALFFYSHLFLGHPELRDMFPVSMSAQRDRLLHALGRIVSDVGNLDSLVPFLTDLGRDHRKFGVTPEHYPAVGASLLAALTHFSGSGWNAELAADWAAAYGLLADVMIDAAAQDERNPSWWDATIIGHERRTCDIAVLKVSTRQPLPYLPGQSVAMEFERRPRLWRLFSMANAPRPDGTLDFHVRIIDGGQVTGALAHNPGIGSALRLGPPIGRMTLDTRSERPIVMAAGGTGLAPLKAILEQLAARPVNGHRDPPPVHLFVGARTAADLYDVADLEKMAARSPWLTLTPALSVEPVPRHGWRAEQGTVADVLARLGTWRDHDAYVCGSSAMVAATTSRLHALGTPPERIFVEDFGWSEL
jgi:NAD(P)H-flavin reductase/hemoglobin-like flavoprotein